ncbi:hypothetical protein BC936DRAFT_145069, partial [Jimgerdemannia flammicorona]
MCRLLSVYGFRHSTVASTTFSNSYGPTTPLQATSDLLSIPSTDVPPVDPTPLQATSDLLSIPSTDVPPVDPTPLQVMSALLPIPSTDLSPVDPTPLQTTSALLPIPSTDVSPVDPTSLKVTSAPLPILSTDVLPVVDDDEESHPSKIDIRLLEKMNRHHSSSVLRGLPRWNLGEVGNRMTKFQTAARGYLLRAKPRIREYKKSISARIVFVTNVQACARGYIIRKMVDTLRTHYIAASRIKAIWRGFKINSLVPEVDNDPRMDQEIISRKAMEDRSKEVMDEVRLLKMQVDVMKEKEAESAKQIEQLKHLDEQVQKESGLRISLET